MQGSLGDAKKLLALASAEDPEAAAEEAARRNREHQAKHRAKAGAYVSAEQLERKARVKAVADKKSGSGLRVTCKSMTGRWPTSSMP